MGVLRLPGLSTGLDTDGIVKSLMQVERRPVTLLEGRKQKLTDEANAWRDLNSRLLNLQGKMGDLKRLAAADWDGKKATIADQTVLTASASAGAQAGTYTVDVVTLAKATTLQSSLSVADPNADRNLTGTITVSGGPGNGKTLDVVATDSLNEIAANINQKSSELGFSASVLQVSTGDYRLVLTGKTGANSHFSLTGTVAQSLKVDAVNATELDHAVDGQIKVNKATISVASNSVSGVVPGLTLNLLKQGATTTVSVTEDNSKVQDAVKGFVDQYNSVVEFISQKTSYDTKEKKAGALFGESLVNSVRSSLGAKLIQPVATIAAEFNSLAMVGVTTQKFSKGDSDVSGKLVLDANKLNEALDKDPDAVRKLFQLDDGTNQGVAVRMEKWLQTYSQTGGLVPRQADSLDKELKIIDDRIKYMDEVVLPQREKRLRNQFAALEKAMTSFQHQGNWLSSQLNGLSTR